MIESFKLPVIIPETLTGSIVSFNDEYGGLPLKSCTSLITGYQEGSGTPSPSNVRPLHAWDKARLFDTQKNLFDMNSDKITGAYISSTGAIVYQAGQDIYTEKIYIKPSTQYTISGKSDTNAIIRIALYSANNSFIGRVLSTSMQNPVVTITPTSQASYFIVNPDITITDIQAEEGQEATAYEPFGNTYTFTFGQDIYQGYIDWKRGVVVGTHGIADLGSLNWQRNAQYINPIFLANIPEAKVAASSGIVPDAICSQYKVDAPNRTNVEGVNYVFTVAYYYNSSYNINIIDKDYTDTTAFKTAMNGVYLAYELANPITIPLGGVNILTQEGQNNIFADCGDTTLEWLKVN
jgi:hypothetical protein